MNKTKFSPAIKKIFSTIFVMSVISLLLVMRNPALFIHPEPWAEDMTVFISDEYNIGFPSTALIPYSGYLHLLPRIIVWIALKFDFSNAMMVINLAVLLIKVLFFYMIYKSKEITSKIIKFSLLAYLTFLPFCEEIYNNVTNLQWWLIPFLALIILKHETNVYETLFDIFMLILLGLTGVNSVMFAVPCAYLIYRAKTKTSLIKNLLVIICACIQFYFLHTSGRADTGKIMYNGGGIDIINLFVNRVIYRTLFCFSSQSYINIAVFISYILILIYTIYHYRKNIIINFVFLFSIVYTIVILYHFLKTQTEVNWMIAAYDANERYFIFLRICTFILLISFLDILISFLDILLKSIFSVRNHNRLIVFSLYLICLVLIKNYPVNFSFEYQFNNDAERFKFAKPGETIKFHFPPGYNWDLIKK